MADFPIRCYTCNKVIGDKWNTYKSSLDSGMECNEALAKVGARRYCCRRMFLTHVELIDKVLLYSDDNTKDLKNKTKE